MGCAVGRRLRAGTCSPQQKESHTRTPLLQTSILQTSTAGANPRLGLFLGGREELGSNGCLFSEQHAALFPLRHRAIDREDAAADFAFMILAAAGLQAAGCWKVQWCKNE